MSGGYSSIQRGGDLSDSIRLQIMEGTAALLDERFCDTVRVARDLAAPLMDSQEPGVAALATETRDTAVHLLEHLRCEQQEQQPVEEAPRPVPKEPKGPLPPSRPLRIQPSSAGEGANANAGNSVSGTGTANNATASTGPIVSTATTVPSGNNLSGADPLGANSGSAVGPAAISANSGATVPPRGAIINPLRIEPVYGNVGGIELGPRSSTGSVLSNTSRLGRPVKKSNTGSVILGGVAPATYKPSLRHNIGPKINILSPENAQAITASAARAAAANEFTAPNARTAANFLRSASNPARKTIKLNANNAGVELPTFTVSGSSNRKLPIPPIKTAAAQRAAEDAEARRRNAEKAGAASRAAANAEAAARPAGPQLTEAEKAVAAARQARLANIGSVAKLRQTARKKANIGTVVAKGPLDAPPVTYSLQKGGRRTQKSKGRTYR